ncbi:MAG: 50S ribosomal protein L6 [Patescibacteria group bacterium]
MSKIGKQPIKISDGVVVDIQETDVVIKSQKGEIILPILQGLKVTSENGVIKVEPKKNTKQVRSNWGTFRSLLNNAVQGLTNGFEKKLIVEGIGYKINKDGNDLVMNLGFSHLVKFRAPANIVFEVEKNTILKIKGFDKAVVGRVAAEIRQLKKPEPYKGTGFRYSDEVVKRKAGKKAASTTGSPSK